jgi:hypothetical protein
MAYQEGGGRGGGGAIGIIFGAEVAVGLVIGLIVMVRVILFLRLVKYRRGSVYNAPLDLRNRLMQENLEVIRNKAHKTTPQELSLSFRAVMEGMTDSEAGWNKQTLDDMVKTLACIAQFEKKS